MQRSRSVRVGLLAVTALALWGVTLEPADPLNSRPRSGAGTVVTAAPWGTEAANLRSILDRPLDRFSEPRPSKHRWPPLIALLPPAALVAASRRLLTGRPSMASNILRDPALLLGPRGPPSIQPAAL